jgi:type II secretory pathway pseudopilin PulG
MEEKIKFSDKLKNSGSWVVLITAAFLVIFGFVYAVQAQRQQEAIDKTNENTSNVLAQVKILSEQNKELAKQNKESSEKAARYAYCNAVILARYTQTGEPIKIEDLDKCVLSSFPEGLSATSGETNTSNTSSTSSAAGGSVAQSTPSGGGSNTPSAPTTPSNPSTPTNPTNPTNPTTPRTNGLTLSPSLQLSPTFLTPGVNLTAPLRVPCIGVPGVLGVC